MEQQAIYAIHELSQQLKANGPALAQLAKFMPIMEINALTQVCSNQQLSEEVRRIASARLEDIINKTYGNQYNNHTSKQFK